MIALLGTSTDWTQSIMDTTEPTAQPTPTLGFGKNVRYYSVAMAVMTAVLALVMLSLNTLLVYNITVGCVWLATYAAGVIGLAVGRRKGTLVWDSWYLSLSLFVLLNSILAGWFVISNSTSWPAVGILAVMCNMVFFMRMRS